MTERVIICPYCGARAKLEDSTVIYGGRNYGKIWLCSSYPACNSYVGCHKGTEVPLGRMADEELRKAKRRAHTAFDGRWKMKAMADDVSDNKARSDAYAWLAETLKLKPEQCHIGMFDATMCNKVVEVCGGKIR